ncbi:helix-turn-helix transcriptional regulator [Phenylobacterium sp. 20VBR1]|uniref:Helix-turn-helix transcriptional regulator n=1 Tax=Phenylobacterium glaciei TaxID=2803784 RepID=A0A941CZ47_9CAUL|nr:helix-turn-helix transcriptional regulator [Phenylobacterium glaciei]MBR7619280.1 helix-turn-helix transcriptional regulator [Phenylobacterium glaciei]
MSGSSFSAKLGLVLKVFNMSRAHLASALAVDKSLVGRWVAGSVTPSTHNLANITRYLADRQPGFTMLDWDRDIEDFAALFGAIAPVLERPFDVADGVPLAIMPQIRSATTGRARDLECFFRTTRPAEAAPGRFLHDQGMVRLNANGLLEVIMGVRETVYRGWLMPVRGQLFCVATDAANGALVFVIFSSVPSGRPQRIDGITLGSSSGSLPGIAAAPIILDRVGDLSGDVVADDRRYREMLTNDPLAPEGSVPPEVVAHLSRDFGPSHLAAGGDWLLQIPLHRSLGRSVMAMAEAI